MINYCDDNYPRVTGYIPEYSVTYPMEPNTQPRILGYLPESTRITYPRLPEVTRVPNRGYPATYPSTKKTIRNEVWYAGTPEYPGTLGYLHGHQLHYKPPYFIPGHPRISGYLHQHQV